LDDKVIVTNVKALEAKYGKAGVTAIRKAIRSLIAADKKRGISTRLVALDDAVAMKKLKAPPVTTVSSCPQNKAAIDAVYTALGPDYLMILGATDVVPHQDLLNPAYAAGDDDDRYAYGDLPYACDAGYSRQVSKFIGPTRVVTRLPDLRGAKKPAHLLGLLKFATKAAPRPLAEYTAGFALSAEVWRGSTELSIANILGPSVKTHLCPSEGPNFKAELLGAGVHFINCHGSPADPTFYGQRGQKYPEALTTLAIAGKIGSGTIAAAECCYGGELYDAETLALPLPICQSYLAQGALAYMGSTTIAYGPAEGNGSADLLTQFFLIQLLGGASIGRAALAARQEFVAQTGQMDPVDLKTLAQFCTYGDPSVHPVSVPSPTHVLKSADPGHAEGLARRERRAKLVAAGEHLQRTKATAERVAKGTASALARKALANIARAAGISGDGFVAYAVDAKGAGARSGTKRQKGKRRPERYHLLIRPQGTSSKQPKKVAIVAKESGNRIVGYRVYFSH
jgi:hypothetical protein